MTGGVSRAAIFDLLDEVKDPEVPVLSVVELGIVRDVRIDAGGVTVVITPTYSGCPAMRVIEEDIRAALTAHGIGPIMLETTYWPAWTTAWLTESAKQKLTAYGIAPPGRAPDTSLVSITKRLDTAASSAPDCPYCGGVNTVIKSEFGATACKSICYCNDCRQPFEQFKAI